MRAAAVLLAGLLAACVGGSPVEPMRCNLPDTVAWGEAADSAFDFEYEIECPGLVRTTTRRSV